jgi:hypothetical protein
MTHEHEHAIAIIKAHGEGKVVQYRFRDDCPWTEWDVPRVPDITTVYEWRIKPEPRETNTELRETIIQLRNWAASCENSSDADTGVDGVYVPGCYSGDVYDRLYYAADQLESLTRPEPHEADAAHWQEQHRVANARIEVLELLLRDVSRYLDPTHYSSVIARIEAAQRAAGE